MKFSAVILAGGKSSRMGRDKALLQLGGQSLLARQISVAREAGASEVLISGRNQVDYSEFGCPVLLDRFVDAGPLAGIDCALEMTTSSLLLVLAVDMPRVSVEVLRALLLKSSGDVGVIPRVNGAVEPLAAFYPRASRKVILDLFSEAHLKTGQTISPAKSPSAMGFAERCVSIGLARFEDLPKETAHFFSNWNSLEQVES